MDALNPMRGAGESRALLRILFLDFDGVLHGEEGERFSRLPLLENALREMPELEVVITSTWRLEMGIEELRQLFSAGLRNRVIGMTPHIWHGLNVGDRQWEIEAFLAIEGIADHTHWIALDDMAPLFEKDCQQLLLVDTPNGLELEHVEQLIAWYESAKNPGSHTI